jgi:sugar/nucleoside kinase (ribokinase family)
MSAPAQFDVLVAGEYFCDLIFSGLGAPPRLGAEVMAEALTVQPGGCYNMAVALTRLGLKTAWASDFGTDIFSRLVLAEAEREGIDGSAFRHVEAPLRRVSAAFSGNGERGFISYSEDAVRPPDFRILTRLRPRWLLQSFRFEPEWLAFMRAAKAAGVSIFSDCRGGDFNLATAGVEEFLALSDVFSPNEAEALALAGSSDMDTALAVLGEIVPTVVIKRGANGASAISEGLRFDAAAPAVEVVDTVGAGDAFNAGFLAGVFWESGFAECLRLAVACGSLSTTGPGSSACPSAARLSGFMARSMGGLAQGCALAS